MNADATEGNPTRTERALLISFSAELLARRKYEATGHSGVSWDGWIGAGETREERMEPFIAHVTELDRLGMLTWPDTDTPGIFWAVKGPRLARDPVTGSTSDWRESFGTAAPRAARCIQTCLSIGQPFTLTWSFTGQKDRTRA